MSHLILIFSGLLWFAGCQVKEESASGQLIASHRPAENSFTLTLPASGSYSAGSVLTFTLIHPFDITVTGSPRLVLTVGGSTLYANYSSGSGTKNLRFTYTVGVSDQDDDGISLNGSVDLAGGSLKFNSTDATLSFTVGNTTGIKIDTSLPTVTAAAPPTVSYYYTGMPFAFTVTYSEPVLVNTTTGIPSVDFTINECTVAGNQVKKAQYVSGSGTNTLTFIYIVENTCNETTGGMPVDLSIKLNSGTISDAAGNTAALGISGFTIPATITNTTRIHGRYPMISNIISPADGIYVPGNTIDFKIQFDRPITVSGTPNAYVNLRIGTDATKQALYYALGSTSNTVAFRYTVIGGDVDLNGVELLSGIINEGRITSTSGSFPVNNVTDIFTPPLTTGVIINAPIPTISGIQLPSPLPTSGYYKKGDSVQVIVQFTEPVVVSGGTPNLQSVIGLANKSFTYLSGSGTSNLIFQYTLVDPDLDTDGVNFTSPLDLNGALIQNASGTNASMDFTFTVNTLFRFDAVAPFVTGSALVANTPSASDYRLGNFIDIDLTFNESVTITGGQIPITINGVARNANYTATGSTATVKRFRYTVVAADANAGQGAALLISTAIVGGTIRDVALNDIENRTFTAISTAGIEVDGTIPTISNFTPLPANQRYKYNDTLTFTVNFSEPVTVTGTPSWAVTLASGGPGAALYTAGTGTSALTFVYTVGSTHVDSNGITMGNTFSGGTIVDASVGNSLAATFTPPTPASLSLVLVDGTTPTVGSINGPLADTYLENEYLSFTVLYSEQVNITGSPQLVLNIGGVTKYADYLSGTGSNSIIYRYQVEAGLQDINGVDVTSHILNSGTVKDLAGNDADLSIVSQNFATAFVDSKAPTITSITPPSNGVKMTGSTLSFVINYDETVTVDTSGGPTLPSISLNIGGVTLLANYASGSGSSAITFTTAALANNHFDAEGIAYSSGNITLGDGVITDTNAHAADLTFTAGSITGIKVVYSSVRSWLDMGTTSGGSVTSVTSSSSPGVNASSSGTNRIASDSDFSNHTSLEMLSPGGDNLTTGSVTGVKTMFIVFKTDAVPALDILLGDGAKGINLTNASDMTFGTSSRIAVDGGAFGASGVLCLSCYNAATKLITIDFDTAQDFNSGITIGSFVGRVAEVWVVDDTLPLTDPQKLKIRDYLNSRY